MLISMFILAFSSSIDSLGIGITYGIKNTKISCLSKIILFSISICISFISILCGDFLNNFLPNSFTSIIGNILIIFMGSIILFQTLKKDNLNFENLNNSSISNAIWQEEKMYTFFIRFLGITIKIIKHPMYSDLNNSNKIEPKEALFLGIALSLDSFCIGIGRKYFRFAIYFISFFSGNFSTNVFKFWKLFRKKIA